MTLRVRLRVRVRLKEKKIEKKRQLNVEKGKKSQKYTTYWGKPREKTRILFLTTRHYTINTTPLQGTLRFPPITIPPGPIRSEIRRAGLAPGKVCSRASILVANAKSRLLTTKK